MKDNLVRNVIIVAVVLIGIAISIGFSFAYFTANIKGNEDAKLMTVNAGTMELTFVDNNTINLPNAKPGDKQSKTFSVQNTGTLDDTYNYNIKLSNLNVTFKEEDLEYTLEEYTDDTYVDLKPDGINKTGFISKDTVNDNKEMYLATNIERPTKKGDTHYYKLTIEFKNLEDVNQEYNYNAEFSGKINIDDSANAKEYKKAYTITTSITNGTVEPPTMDVLPEQDSTEFTITPTDGYIVRDISCTNEQQVEQTDNTFIVKNVTSDSNCTITIEEKKVYKVTINTDKGTVEPSEMNVTEGEDSGVFTLNYPTNCGCRSSVLYLCDYVDALNCSNGQSAVKDESDGWKIQNVTSDTTCTPVVTMRPPNSDPNKPAINCEVT